MTDLSIIAILVSCSALLLIGILFQLRAHNLRKQWVSTGLGVEEIATGLASIAAVPLFFPRELDTAQATNSQLAVVVMRRFTEHPEDFGSKLAKATRIHETGWRIDYDLFATTLLVDKRVDAVKAVRRLGRAACGDEPSKDLRVGIALCPEDTNDLLEAIDIALTRARSFSTFVDTEENVNNLFTEANRQGPRISGVIARSFLAILVLIFTTTLSSLIAKYVQDIHIAFIVAPTVLGIATSGGIVSPLARNPTSAILSGSILCLLSGALLVNNGLIVAATPLMAFAALLAGVVCARFIYRAVWVLPILFVAGISDTQSVQGGLTNNLLSSDKSTNTENNFVLSLATDSVRLIDYLVIHIPSFNGIWILGLVDILAIGLLLGLSHLYWQPILRTVIALATALLVSTAFVNPVPVLPLLGTAWALVNWSLVWQSSRFSLRRLTYLGG